MSKLVGLVVAASALIVLISAGLLYATDQEKLEQELNEAAKKGSGEAERILKAVPWSERDTVKVDGLSVHQILSFRDTSCSLRELDILRRIINKQFALKNRGVSEFVNSHIAQRKKSCGQNFHSILQGAVQEFQTDDLKKVKALHSKRWIYRIERSARKAADLVFAADYEGKDVKDERFSMCVRIIKKLSVAMRFDGWESEISDKKQLEFIEYWYNLLETCKRYTETICHLEICSLPSAAKQKVVTSCLPWEDECKAIKGIGESDKRFKEYKNHLHQGGH